MSVNDNVIITSTGVEIKLHGIPSMLVEKVRTSVKFPDPPTYTITTVAGLVEKHPFNDKDMEADTELATEENIKLWAEYIVSNNTAHAEQNDRMMRVVLSKGVEVTLPESTEWLEIQKWLHVEIPDDPRELKYHYILTEVIGSPSEYMDIMSKIMRMSGLSEEALSKAQEMFQHPEEQKTVEQIVGDN